MPLAKNCMGCHKTGSLAPFQLTFQTEQVGVHIVVAMVFCEVDEDTSGTASVTRPAEATVADSSARGTAPLWVQ
uniref:Uncharacterized protein n=1 Tax=Anguilla anguilla TaxID=7936 RepID=A0A0E9WID5_ANGAN